MTPENKTVLTTSAEKYNALTPTGRAYVDGVLAGLELQLHSEDTPTPAPAN